MNGILKYVLTYIVFLLCIDSGTPRFLVIPGEFATLVSFLWTNLPPIQKGIDSKFGAGFRLGPHADFQMQFEVGPQILTDKQPAGQQKRHVMRQPSFALSKPSTPEGWLKSWSDNINSVQVSLENDEQIPSFVADDPTVGKQSFVQKLRKLYKMNEEDK